MPDATTYDTKPVDLKRLLEKIASLSGQVGDLSQRLDQATVKKSFCYP